MKPNRNKINHPQYNMQGRAFSIWRTCSCGAKIFATESEVKSHYKVVCNTCGKYYKFRGFIKRKY